MSAAQRRGDQSSRMVGHAIAVFFNVGLLFLINIYPGWQTETMLTPATADVLGWVNLSMLVNIVVNLAYFYADPKWFRTVGDLLIAGVGFGAVLRVWQVFPFDISGSWYSAVRVLLVVAALGTAIAGALQLARLIGIVLSGGWTARD